MSVTECACVCERERQGVCRRERPGVHMCVGVKVTWCASMTEREREREAVC